MRLVLRDRSTKNIQAENDLLIACFKEVMEILSDGEIAELVQEYFKEAPYQNDDQLKYEALNNTDKVIQHLKTFAFVTNDIMKLQYEFWKSLDLLGKQEYYNFGGLDQLENSKLSYAEFKKRCTHKNCIWIQDIGMLHADLYFSRTPRFIELGYQNYLTISQDSDKFTLIEDVDRLFNEMNSSIVKKYMLLPCYEKRYIAGERKKYKEDYRINTQLRYPTATPYLKQQTKDVELKLNLLYKNFVE